MSKRINYKEGDLITIPLTDSRKAICKIIFAPKGMLKQVICCNRNSTKPKPRSSFPSKFYFHTFESKKYKEFFHRKSNGEKCQLGDCWKYATE